MSVARSRTRTVPESIEVTRHKLLRDWAERRRVLKSRTERALLDKAHCPGQGREVLKQAAEKVRHTEK
jgi:hypothetical protein